MFDDRNPGAPRAIVVGSGAAGTSAAFRLKQAGAQVTVVEKDTRLGGRARTERVDGFIVDTGAGLMPGSYAALYSLMNDAGIGDALAPMSSPVAVSRNGRLHYLDLAHPVRSILGTSLLGLGSKVSLSRLGPHALRMWRSLGFDSITGAAPFDTETLTTFAHRTLSRDAYEYLINPTQKIMYTVRSDEASVVDLFWVSKNLFHPKAFCVRGGMDRVVEGVSKHFATRTGTEVLRVEETPGEVRVTMRDAAGHTTTETADVCVIATPARDVPKIDAGLPDGPRRFLSELRYSWLTDLHLRLRKRPDEKAVLIMIPDDVDPDLAGLLLDHNKGEDRAPPGKGAISAYFMDGWATKMYGESDERIFEAGIAKIERAMPGVAALVEGYHVQRWDFAATASYPGYYRKLAEFERGLDLGRRVQLAGDYFAMASVNTAVTSGAIAAQRLAANHFGSRRVGRASS